MTGTQGQRSQRDLLRPHFTVLQRGEFWLSSGLPVLTMAWSQVDPPPLSQTLVFSGNFSVPTTSTYGCFLRPAQRLQEGARSVIILWSKLNIYNTQDFEVRRYFFLP